MADLSVLLLTGLVMTGGYLLKKSKEPYTNIYQSNHIQEGKDYTQKKALEKELASYNSDVTGVYNLSLRGGKTGRPEESVSSVPPPAPVPSASTNQLLPASKGTFTRFSTMQSPSVIDGGEIAPHDKSVMPFAKSFDNTVVSEEKYSNVMRNHTGADRVFNKRESTEQFNSGIKVSGLQGIALRDHFSDDRFAIASTMKQGEKPFEPVILGAPKAWTVDNPIQPREFVRTLEELRVNPKESYTGRVIPGARPSEMQRGILGQVTVKAPPTTSDRQFLRAGPAASGEAASVPLNLDAQPTAREAYIATKYITPAMSVLPSARTNESKFTAPTKTIREGSFFRNVGTALSGMIGDYTKSTLSPVSPERASYNTRPIANVQSEKSGAYVDTQNAPRTTSKESLKQHGNVSNISVQIKEPGSTLWHQGKVDISARQTSKQHTNEGYTGTISKPRSMGYLVNPATAKTSLKELMNPEYTPGGSISTIGEKSAIGQISVNSNKLLAEQGASRQPAPSRGGMSSRDTTGLFTQSNRDDMKINTVSGDRFLPELVTEQLKGSNDAEFPHLRVSAMSLRA